ADDRLHDSLRGPSSSATRRKPVLRAFRHTRCVTVLQLIFCSTELIPVPFRLCWATAISRPRKSTHTLPTCICVRLTTAIIRALVSSYIQMFTISEPSEREIVSFISGQRGLGFT